MPKPLLSFKCPLSLKYFLTKIVSLNSISHHIRPPTSQGKAISIVDDVLPLLNLFQQKGYSNAEVVFNFPVDQHFDK